MLLTSCNDDEDNECLLAEDIALSDCPAEDISQLCQPFFCGADIEFDQGPRHIDFLLPLHRDCEPIDCNTLDCGGEGGIFEDLQVDGAGFPWGTIETLEGRKFSFDCIGQTDFPQE